MARLTALEHVSPVAAGLIAGTAAALTLPRTIASADFFSVSAQVLPVLLLALAIEARMFSAGGRRDAESGPLPNVLEQVRMLLSFGTVAALFAAELHALQAVATPSTDSRAAWIEHGALAWGFTTVALLAILGLGRPRLIATLQWHKPLGKAHGVVVEVGASNEFGDKDIAPVWNLLVPNGLTIYHCDPNGNIDQSKTVTTLPLAWQHAGVEQWHYTQSRDLVSAGDATIMHLSIGGLIAGRRYPLLLRLDHAELPGGRITAEEWVSVSE